MHVSESPHTSPRFLRDSVAAPRSNFAGHVPSHNLQSFRLQADTIMRTTFVPPGQTHAYAPSLVRYSKRL